MMSVNSCDVIVLQQGRGKYKDVEVVWNLRQELNKVGTGCDKSRSQQGAAFSRGLPGARSGNRFLRKERRRQRNTQILRSEMPTRGLFSKAGNGHKQPEEPEIVIGMLCNFFSRKIMHLN